LGKPPPRWRERHARAPINIPANATLFGDMDILGYTYDAGNKLVKVTDIGNATYGFKDGANLTTEYLYDANGNLKTDANKNITAIQYNYLNLPTQVSFGATKNINYIYDASGTKLKKVVNDNGTITTTNYAGNYVYENDALQFFNTAEGYVEPINASDYNQGFSYVYQYKDHLGNIRLSYKNISLTSTPSLQLVEENNYYPFGLEHKGYNNVVNGTENNYKTYQGQEISKELGYNMLEFKYRHYDPAIGRFVAVDPLASKYPYNSTYAFQENKLGLGVELEGLELVYRKGTDPKFKTQFAKTVKFMNSKGTSGKMAELNESGRTELVDNTGKRSFYRPSEGAIYFDPTAAVETDEGHILSPATVLDHEIDHALQDKENPGQFKNDIDPIEGYDPAYDTKEEKRVITTSEQKTEKKHGEIKEGEVTRTNHNGTVMDVTDPTSTKNATQRANQLEEVIITVPKKKENGQN